MAAPIYRAEDYLAALQALMPRGRVWPRDADATQTKTLSGLAPSYVRNNQRAAAVLVESLPSTTYELLPEWEATLGLPDPCAGPSPTIEGRRAQVVARFAGSGGQSIPYMVTFAANLGYTITITEFIPAQVGILRAGQPLNGSAWAYAWQVNSALNTIRYARAGAFSAGEPLASWGNAVLECELKAIAPAHTVPIFSYS
jgi:uncharacterized protein YmfQ (DUF2313 family)